MTNEQSRVKFDCADVAHVEVCAVKDLNNDVTVCLTADETPDYWGVYIRMREDRDITDRGLAIQIADHPTHESALAFAERFSFLTNVSVVDRTPTVNPPSEEVAEGDKLQQLIFFCPEDKVQILADATRFVVFNPHLGDDFFKSLREGKSVIVSDKYPITMIDWTSPDDAEVVFIDGFGVNRRLREQAEGRVRRINRADTESSKR